MHKKNKIVISNTTPIICLSIVDQLELLKNFYGKIFVPQAIHNEIIAGGETSFGFNEYLKADWIEKKTIATSYDLNTFGCGETEDEAIRDLCESIIEYYEHLKSNYNRLGVLLQRDWDFLSRIILELEELSCN